MKVKNILLSGFAALSVFTSCNDDFLEKNPVTSLGESNAFLTYDNFKSFFDTALNLIYPIMP